MRPGVSIEKQPTSEAFSSSTSEPPRGSSSIRSVTVGILSFEKLDHGVRSRFSFSILSRPLLDLLAQSNNGLTHSFVQHFIIIRTATGDGISCLLTAVLEKERRETVHRVDSLTLNTFIQPSTPYLPNHSGLPVYTLSRFRHGI